MHRLAVCVVLLGCKVTPTEKTKPIKAIEVSYRLDPRLAGGTYGGERWIAGPNFTSSAQPGRTAVVEAKANAKWSASDPDMVTVSPLSTGRVRITVRKPGESLLTLSDVNARTELVVRGRAIGSSAMQLQIAQKGDKP